MKSLVIDIARWLGSPEIAAMDMAEQGGCLRLLLHASENEDGLPDDDSALATLSRLGNAWFEKPAGSALTRGERIRGAFAARDGRLFLDGLNFSAAKAELS